MPCESIVHMKISCAENIRWPSAAGYLHVEVELIISLLDGGVLAQAGRELWQLHSIALVGIACNFRPLQLAGRPMEPTFQTLKRWSRM